MTFNLDGIKPANKEHIRLRLIELTWEGLKLRRI